MRIVPPVAVQAREASIVRNLIAAAEPMAVVILGGVHDLGPEIRRQSGGRVCYVRVECRKYRELAGIQVPTRPLAN